MTAALTRCASCSETCEGASSLVQDDAQERSIDCELPLVVDEPELLEFPQKEGHSRARGPDHSRKRVPRDLRDDPSRFALLAVAREQQQRPRQPLIDGV